MNLFFNYPFLFFGIGYPYFGIKPFVLCFIVYYLLSLRFMHKCFPRRTEPTRKIWERLKQSWKNGLTKGEKIFIIAYPFLPLFYLFQYISNYEKTFLTELAENYVYYEILLFFFAVVLRLIWIRTQGSLWKQAKILDYIVQIMTVFSVFSTTILRQPNTFLLGNIICFVLLGCLVLHMEYQWRTRLPAPLASENKDIFRPVEKYNNLLPQQMLIADEIIAIIRSNCAESSASICVSGEWGVGKTSIVNGAVQQLKETNGDDGNDHRQYECIYINAMELDTLSSLFDYFFFRIRDILKKHGAYVGLGSDYQKFISASLGKITDSSIASLLESKLFPSSGDYRKQLKALEENIHTTLAPDMILVIVDDVERCEENKARSFISFIKEIATMRGVVTIFITDFKYLFTPDPQDSSIDAEKESGFYYDKFFNYRIHVPTIEAEEFMQKKDADVSLEELRNLFSIRPSRDIFLSTKERLELKDQEQKKQQQQGGDTGSVSGTDRINQLSYLFSRILGTPRVLAKYYRSLSQILQLLAAHYLDHNILGEDAKAYFDDIHLDQVLFVLNFLQACAPNECIRILDLGLDYFETKNAEISDYHRLITELGDGLLYSYSPIVGIGQSYSQLKAWHFLQMCLQGKPPENTNYFDSKEEEWFAGIEHNDIQLINEHWPDMVSAVIRVLTWKDPERGEKYLKKLFSFAHGKLAAEEWSINRVFRIFDHQWRNEGAFSKKIPILKLFWEQFSDFLNGVAQTEAKIFDNFATIYLWQEARTIVPVICLFIPSDGKWNTTYRTLNEKFELLLLGRESENKELNTLLDQIFPGLVNLELPPGNDAFARLDILAKKAEEFLVKKRMNGLDDMENIIEQLRLVTEEFRCMEKIKQTVMKSAQLDCFWPDSYIQNADLDDMDSIIKFFQSTVYSDEPKERERLQNNLQVFFNRLCISEVELSDEQYQSLQEILTRYMELYGPPPLLYRKILADRWNPCQNNSPLLVTDESSH